MGDAIKNEFTDSPLFYYGMGYDTAVCGRLNIPDIYLCKNADAVKNPRKYTTNVAGCCRQYDYRGYFIQKGI